jgi:hypothetical protein
MMSMWEYDQALRMLLEREDARAESGEVDTDSPWDVPSTYEAVPPF